MKYLALWFESPLQSWGIDSKFGLRSTFNFPTKSGIAGIILSSLGRGGEEIDFLRLFSSFKETAISFSRKEDHIGTLATIDFQTIGNGYDVNDQWYSNMIPKKREGGTAVGGGSKLIFKHYLQDAYFGVIQEIDENLCAEVINGLINPVWPIYLGRRCCIPTYPIFQGEYNLEEEALAKINDIASSKDLVEKERLIEGENDDASDSFFINDVPVKFGSQKEYKDRRISILIK